MMNRKSFFQLVAWTALILLLIPPLWYSLRTPFALIDDYNSWFMVRIFSHISGIIKWCYESWLHPDSRFRITFDLYNLLTWALLDGSSAAHHIMRWILKGIVVWSTFNILRLLAPARQSVGLAFGAFGVVYIFFPNNPEARLAPQELLTVAFLALLLYELGRLCARAQGDLAAINLARYLWMIFVFTAMLWSKEPNIVLGAIAVVILICLNPRRWARVLPFAAILLITGIRVWMGQHAGGYGNAPITAALLRGNNAWCLKSLFLWQTSWGCALLLAVPLLIGVCYLAGQTWRILRAGVGGAGEGKIVQLRTNPTIIFYWIILLNAAAFYVVLLTSWDQVLRYFYPLVYLLALWIGLTLLPVGAFPSRRRLVVSGLALLCAIYFIGVNYYNFVYQFACQYYQRRVEQDVLRTLDRLLKQGNTVNLTIESEYENKIADYFNAYLPFYKQTDYRITVAAITTPYNPGYAVVPGADIQKPGSYYISLHDTLPPGHHLVRCFDYRHASRILRWCDRVSTVFRFGRPALYWMDAGAPDIGRHGEDIRRWCLSGCGGRG